MQASFRSEDHHHRSAFEFGSLLNGGYSFRFQQNLVQQFLSRLGQRDFPTPEHDSDFHLVLIDKKTLDMVDFGLKVMVSGFWPNLDFLDLESALFLFRFLLFLGLLVFVLPIIHDFADRWIGCGRNFHQIETGFPCRSKGLVKRNDAALFAFGIDQPNFLGLDFPVDIDLVGLDRSLLNPVVYACTSWFHTVISS